MCMYTYNSSDVFSNNERNDLIAPLVTENKGYKDIFVVALRENHLIKNKTHNI